MTELHRYRMVIALDATQYAEIVLEHALDQAARHDTLDLHFLTVIDKHDPVDPAKNKLARLVLDGFEAFRHGARDWRTRLHVRVGKPADEIANLAAEVRADLLVVGRFAQHRGRVVEDILAAAGCPALVVGLTDHVVDSPKQCPDCVAVREASAGERWFCAKHSSSGEVRLTTFLPSSTTGSGNLLW